MNQIMQQFKNLESTAGWWRPPPLASLHSLTERCGGFGPGICTDVFIKIVKCSYKLPVAAFARMFLNQFMPNEHERESHSLSPEWPKLTFTICSVHHSPKIWAHSVNSTHLKCSCTTMFGVALKMGTEHLCSHFGLHSSDYLMTWGKGVVLSSTKC